MKIYFLVATQPDNLGDLLINKMLIDEVSKYGEVFVDAEGIPEKFKHFLLKRDNVKDFVSSYAGSLKRKTMLGLLSVVKKDFDFYFKSPGPYGGEGFMLKSLVNRAVMTYQFRYFSKAGLSVNAVGNDIILNNKLNVFCEKYINKYFSNTLVRSKENIEELKSHEINNVDYISDVGFLYKEFNNSVKKNKVFISFRDLKDVNYNKKIDDYLENVIPFFKAKAMEVVFFHQVESDKLYNTFLYKKFKKYDCEIIRNCVWYDEISENYNQSSYIITNRLHVMILGIVHHAVPLLVLKDDAITSKINRILRDNDIEHLVQDINLDFKEFHNNYGINQAKIINIAKENLKNCQENIANIFKQA